MSTVSETSMKELLTATTTVSLQPRFEGANICTWIGFKHVNYLVEEAVLEHFRAAELPVGRLFEQYGLGLDIVALDTRILNALHLDDVVAATIVPAPPPAGPDGGGTDGGRELGFTVSLTRNGARHKDVAATVSVLLRRDTYVDPTDAVPPELARFTVDRIGTAPPAGHGFATGHETAHPAPDPGAADPVLAGLTAQHNAYGWRWRVPYQYCHFNERMQMSGYLRLLEATVDLFLADRGVSIKTLLDAQRWIPVVPHSSLRLLDETLMEEDLFTVFTVEELFRDITYRSRVDTYVRRGGDLVQTSTGTITHGYAVINNRRDWSLVGFDARLSAALRGAETRRESEVQP